MHFAYPLPWWLALQLAAAIAAAVFIEYRRPLAPLVSPKKTVEGALGGVVFGTALFTIVGAWWLPAVPAGFRALVGVTIVALGIAGDLFESMLKRSANVKDSSSLIPGHGGILDRIDALLFAAPVYYIVLRYV